MKVAKQVNEANAGAASEHSDDSQSKDPSPLMRRKLADQAQKGGSDNTYAGQHDDGMAV